MINDALKTGRALAITVGAGYAACALLFWLLPDRAVGLMNALFHGLDFGKLQSAASAFDFAGFAYALVVMVVWAFLLGTFFGFLRAPKEQP